MDSPHPADDIDFSLFVTVGEVEFFLWCSQSQGLAGRRHGVAPDGCDSCRNPQNSQDVMMERKLSLIMWKSWWPSWEQDGQGVLGAE